MLFVEGTTGTTYPESHNMRLAAAFVRNNFSNHYLIYHVTDCFTYPNLYSVMNHEINKNRANLVTTGSGHLGYLISTACFALRVEDESWWPPLVFPGNHEIVEYLWKRHLDGKKIHYYANGDKCGYFTSHNYEEQLEWLRRNKS